MAKRIVDIGDVLEIPLSNGQKAYGQYVFADKKQGPLLQVFDLITDQNNDVLSALTMAKPLFPPVITGISAAVKSKMWKVIGHLPVNNFTYPNFISAIYSQKTGKVDAWYLWNGEEYLKLGATLPERYRRLEYKLVWSPYDVVDRIEFGRFPQYIVTLINDNRFASSES